MKTCPCNIQRFSKLKKKMKNFDIFLIFAQNINCGYTSNEYQQSMFWSKNKKKYVYPCIPQFCTFAILKWGSRGYTLHRHVFLMGPWFIVSSDRLEKPVVETCDLRFTSRVTLPLCHGGFLYIGLTKLL